MNTLRGFLLSLVEGFGLSLGLNLSQHDHIGLAAAVTLASGILLYADGKFGWSR